MKDYRLSNRELEMLRLAHKGLNDKRKADRVKAVYLLGSGWALKDVHEALLLDEDTLRNYYARYEDSNLFGLLDDKYIVNKGLLSDAELEYLDEHLQTVTYRTAKEIVAFIKDEFGEDYSVSGVHALLKRLNYVYKKPQRRPAKADAKAQENFIRRYHELCKKLGEDDSLCFMDTTHPRHETAVEYGWMKRGVNKEIFTTATQPSITISGVLDIKRHEVITDIFKGSMNMERAKDTLELLRRRKPRGWIYLICDKAGYYHNDEVKAYAKSMCIKMIYLPAYSPNLNLIERVWLYFKKVTLYNRYYPSFAEFEDACRTFFKNIRQHKPALRTLLTEKFQRFAAA